MTDLEVTRSSEFMVAHVEGMTRESEDFLDSYLSIEMIVVDAGRIIVPDSLIGSLLDSARERGLTANERTVAR